MIDVITLTTTVYNSTTGQDVDIRLSNQVFNPINAPPYRSDMDGQPSVYREIFANGESFGVATHDHGMVVASNYRGDWDWLETDDVAVDGRAAILRVGDPSQGIEGHTVMLHGVLAHVPVGKAEAQFILHDRSTAILDQRAVEDTYSGDNVAPDGVEGAEALADTAVNFVIGQVARASVQLVNETKRIYVVSAAVPGLSAPIIDGVSDKGAALDFGAQVADLAALEAATVPSGQFYWCGAPGERVAIRLGAEPQGTLAVSMHWGQRSAVDLFEGLLEALGEIVSDDDLSVLRTNWPAAPLGGAFDGTSTLRQVLDGITATIGAGYWLDRTNRWRIRVIEPPVGTVTAFFAVPSLDRPMKVTEVEIKESAPLLTNRDGGGIPPHTVTLGFARNHVVESGTALAGLAEADKDVLTTQWRYATTGKSATIADRHRNAVEYEAETLFQNRANALAEADRRRAILGIKRYTITVALSPSTAAIELNDIVRARFRWAPDGALFRVSAIRFDLPDSMVLTIWKPRQ